MELFFPSYKSQFPFGVISLKSKELILTCLVGRFSQVLSDLKMSLFHYHFWMIFSLAFDLQFDRFPIPLSTFLHFKGVISLSSVKFSAIIYSSISSAPISFLSVFDFCYKYVRSQYYFTVLGCFSFIFCQFFVSLCFSLDTLHWSPFKFTDPFLCCFWSALKSISWYHIFNYILIPYFFVCFLAVLRGL